MSTRVIHFEIPADDPQRAVDFYTRVFDWKFRNGLVRRIIGW
jgi:predicted enzyme related to lactoylglutathione lyase